MFKLATFLFSVCSHLIFPLQVWLQALLCVLHMYVHVGSYVGILLTVEGNKNLGASYPLGQGFGCASHSPVRAEVMMFMRGLEVILATSSLDLLGVLVKSF